MDISPREEGVDDISDEGTKLFCTSKGALGRIRFNAGLEWQDIRVRGRFKHGEVYEREREKNRGVSRAKNERLIEGINNYVGNVTFSRD